jgi:hypothetical protein
LQHKLYDFQQETVADANLDSLGDLNDDEDFDEEQKEAEEDIKSNVSNKSESEDE